MKIFIRCESRDQLRALEFAFEENVDLSIGSVFGDDLINALKRQKKKKRKIGIVLPTNSFGFMATDIERDYMERFGGDIEVGIRKGINDRYGELLIGQSMVAPSNDKIYNYLIVSSIMRTPFALEGENNIDTYYSFHSILKLAIKKNIDVLVTPMLFANSDPYINAIQMRFAYELTIKCRVVNTTQQRIQYFIRVMTEGTDGNMSQLIRSIFEYTD